MNTTEKISIKPNGWIHLNLQDTNSINRKTLDFIKDRILHTYRNPERNTLRLTNSIGFNYGLIYNHGSHFDFIIVQYGKKSLLTSREYLLETGHYFQFRKSYETQIFLPIELFGMDKVRQWIQKSGKKFDSSSIPRQKSDSQLSIF